MWPRQTQQQNKRTDSNRWNNEKDQLWRLMMTGREQTAGRAADTRTLRAASLTSTGLNIWNKIKVNFFLGNKFFLKWINSVAERMRAAGTVVMSWKCVCYRPWLLNKDVNRPNRSHVNIEGIVFAAHLVDEGKYVLISWLSFIFSRYDTSSLKQRRRNRWGSVC